MKATLIWTVLALLLVVAVPAAAQASDADVMQQLRTDIQADRQALVAANLGLTEAEGEAFWPVYRDYRNEMSKVGDRMQKLILDFAEVWESPTEDDAKSMVDELLAIQHQELKVRKSYVKKFRKALPETKVARFLQIENKIDIVIDVGLADSIPLITTGG